MVDDGDVRQYICTRNLCVWIFRAGKSRSSSDSRNFNWRLLQRPTFPSPAQSFREMLS